MTEDIITESKQDFKPISDLKLKSLADNIGKKFGRLTVVGFPGSHLKRKTIMAECKCDCGNVKIIAFTDVRRFHTSSCGCRMAAQLLKVHGEANTKVKKATKEYIVWVKLRARSSLRGREVCEEWLDKKVGYFNFLKDMDRGPEKCYFTRVDKSKGFYKDNCCWRPVKPKVLTKLQKLQKADAEFNKNSEWVTSSGEKSER